MTQLQKSLNDNGFLLTSESPEIINSENDIILTINNVQITKEETEKQGILQWLITFHQRQ